MLKSRFFQFFGYVLCASAVDADIVGIIGGTVSDGANPAYVAFISSTGDLIPLGIDGAGGFPSISGSILSVAINRTGTGIIGGQNNLSGGAAYAAFISSTGDLIPLGVGGAGGFPSTSGEIDTVDINDSGAGIIGGHYLIGLQPAYAALVSPSGNLIQLGVGGVDGFPSTSGAIYGVAINDSGFGIIGGHSLIGLQPAYAALVSPIGALHQLGVGGVGGFPLTNGIIWSVAINNSGAGIIGGGDNYANLIPAYAALVSSSGDLKQLGVGGSQGFPSALGSIFSVAINDSGSGIIGGQDLTGLQPAYAALVSPSGDLIQLGVDGAGGFPSTSGTIYGVAINDSGSGIIGGLDGTGLQPAYAALVSPSGDLIQLGVNGAGGFPSISGRISSVAINNLGIGLIEGIDNAAGDLGYEALVAPSGNLTRLSSNCTIPPRFRGVALNDLVAPPSIGPYFSAIYSQLAAVTTVETHLATQSRIRKRSSQSNVVAALDDESNRAQSMQYASSPGLPSHTIWIEPFGNYLHLRAQEKIPSYTNKIAGILAAYDHHFSSDCLLGCGVGYAYDSLHYSQDLGHGTLQEELVCLYMSRQKRHLRLNAMLWAGLDQFSNHRQALGFIGSKAKTHGWLLSPHIEIATPHMIRENDSWNLTIEPFVMCDYVNDWQKHFTETGRSGFNLVMENLYIALVQTELGLRFYEEWQNSRGSWLWEEKISYINQTPINVHDVNTFFIQSIASFPIAIGSSKVLNLAGIQLSGTFVPRNSSYPLIGVDLQASLGSSLQSYYAGLHVGKNF